LDPLAVGAVHPAWAVPSIPTILSVRFMLIPNGHGQPEHLQAPGDDARTG